MRVDGQLGHVARSQGRTLSLSPFSIPLLPDLFFHSVLSSLWPSVGMQMVLSFVYRHGTFPHLTFLTFDP